MSISQIEDVLLQSKEIPTIRRIYFEGGEPFLFYPVLVNGIEKARKYKFEVGIVTNAYWATDKEDSISWLEPLARQGIADLSLSTDEYHDASESEKNVRRAKRAAKYLKIPVNIFKIRSVPPYSDTSRGKYNEDEIYFRGRAAVNLAPKAKGKAWNTFTECPEEPPNISRVHIDSYGNVQFCQGITIGNIWKKRLDNIMRELIPENHPLIGPLIRGGPALLSKELRIKPRKSYADACHMCYEIRCKLRRQEKFRKILVPDQAYGESVKNNI